MSILENPLCEMFLGADIPLKKFHNPFVKKFFPAYRGKKVPDESTLRKNVVPKFYDQTFNVICDKIGNNTWMPIDETTDACARKLANVVVVICSKM